MAEKPEDLNLPNAVISRLVKETVSYMYTVNVYLPQIIYNLKVQLFTRNISLYASSGGFDLRIL